MIESEAVLKGKGTTWKSEMKVGGRLIQVILPHLLFPLGWTMQVMKWASCAKE